MTKIDIFSTDRQLLLERLLKTINTPNIFIREKCLFYLKNSVGIEELSKILNKSSGQIIAFFWERGQKITKNHNLSEELLFQYCESLGMISKKFDLDFNVVVNDYLNNLFDQKKVAGIEWKKRPPVVSIMGHIDHGKTTLASSIRGINEQKEAGDITQKISAFQIKFGDKQMVLLDTPGHQDFIRLRQRGALLTDVVVLVIDSEEGIMSQTKEIIEYLKKNSLPIIVFVNFKTNKTDILVSLDKIKNQLQNEDITPIEWGGKTLILSGSAKDPKASKELLDNIFAFFDDYKTLTDEPAFGIVIDSYLQSKSNIKINKILIQGGVLEANNCVFLGGKIGKVKYVLSSDNNKINQALPGDIVQVVGCDLVELGERAIVVSGEEFGELDKEIQFKNQTMTRGASIFSEKENCVSFFLLADTQNSLQSLMHLLSNKTHPNICLRVIGNAVGQIGDSDLNVINITGSILLSFNVNLSSFCKKFLKEKKIDFFENNTIYQVTDLLKNIFLKFSETDQITVEEETGRAKISVVYKFSKGNIAGCQVIQGVISRSNIVNLMRGSEKKYSGKIKSLQVNKIDINEVKAGKECGIVLDKFNDCKEGDIFISYKLVKKNK